jgi:hypothetical protein
MCTSVKHEQYKLVVVLLPEQQLVGLDVTFPLSLVVACEDVSLVLWCKFLATEQRADNIPQFIKWETALLATLDIPLEPN